MPWLWVGIAVTSAVLMVAMAPFQALAPTFVADHFGQGVGAYGLLFAFEALGMTVGTVVFGQVNPRSRRIWQIFGFLALNDLFAVLMTRQDSYEVAAALMVVRGTLIGYAIALWSTLMMEWVPDTKLARVTSLDFFGAIGLVPARLRAHGRRVAVGRAGDHAHCRLHPRRADVGRAAVRALGARGGMMVR